VPVIPGNQPIELIAKGAVSPEGPLVEQTLDATAETHLVGVPLGTNRPAHLAMPAAAKDQHGNASNPCCNNS